MKTPISILLTSSLANLALGRQVPQNIRDLYDSIRAQKACGNELKGGFYSQENDSKSRFPNCESQLLYVVLTVGTQILDTAEIIFPTMASCISRAKTASL